MRVQTTGEDGGRIGVKSLWKGGNWQLCCMNRAKMGQSCRKKASGMKVLN